MTNFQKEIDELQQRMADLERQKEEYEINEQQKSSSMKHNLSIFEKQLLSTDDVFNQYRPKAEKGHQVQQLIQQEEQRLQKIFNEEYEMTRREKCIHNCPLSKRGREIQYEIHCLKGNGPIWNHVTSEAVYNMLKIIDNRLTKLENNI